MPVVTAVLAAGALILLFTWWRAPNVHINGRLDTGNYDTTGTVVIGYTLFALALALALGAIWRRAAASLTVAFVGYFAVRISVDYCAARPPRRTAEGDLRRRPAAELPLQRTHHQLYATINGKQIVSMHGGGGFLGGHVQAAAPGISKAVFHVVYQPQSHFWPLQLTETGLFAVVAGILILFAAWWTRQRTS